MRIKKTIITKEISAFDIDTQLTKTHKPGAGDVGLFRVLEIGKHQSVQSDSKRNVSIFPGDHILATFANRYATSQFEGYVPETWMEQFDILGAGGAIGIVKSKNASLSEIEPTKVELIGYAVDSSKKVINTQFNHAARPTFTGKKTKAKVILSIGATMDSGKTTTAAYVTRGLTLGGKKVGFIKLTGTAYTKDKDFVSDCGAEYTNDFSDAGYPSTFLTPINEILSIYEYLRTDLDDKSLDFIVMEIADGILQKETRDLITHDGFMATIDHVVFSCGDSLSALKGLERLEEIGIHPSLLCGKFTMSELLIKEVQQWVQIPIFGTEQLELQMANHLFY